MVSFTLFGCKICISLLFTASVTFMLLTDKTSAVSYLLIAILIHEAGHFISMIICRADIKEINLLPFAVDVKTTDKGSAAQHLLINSSGVLSNLIFAVLFYLLYLNGQAVFGWLSAANAAVGVYNLLPIKSLDGNEILVDLLRIFSVNDRISAAISVIFRIGFAVFLIFSFINTNNPLPLLFGLYLFTLA